MSSTQIGLALVAALLLFWVVGAYNRIVRLRGELGLRFGAFDAQGRARHDLLETQLDLLAPALTAAAPRLEALRAACRQADAARQHASDRRAAANAVTSLRLAEEILADARARVPVPHRGPDELATVAARLAEVDAALAFARREFNDAVAVYNEAVRQFPTLVVASAFGLRPAAIL